MKVFLKALKGVTPTVVVGAFLVFCVIDTADRVYRMERKIDYLYDYVYRKTH